MNRSHLKLLFIIICFAKAMLFSQSKYPADSLLASSNISLIKKIGILPIAGFQRLSYNIDFMNCQFHPSCSNYGARAIKEHGILLGSFMAADRVVRCNPAALEYHMKSKGAIDRNTLMLIDPLVPINIDKPTKSPALAALMSAVIPGTGRMYSGRWLDGLFGFTRFLFYSTLTAYAYQKDAKVLAGFTGAFTFVIYGGEIYGAYRTAKYY